MVQLVFNAGAVVAATDRDVSMTFGGGMRHMRWTDRRHMTFDDFSLLLRDSPVGNKDGACYTPALFRGHKRTKDDADRITMAVLDSDCGHTLDEIKRAVEARGWETIIHSTFSHMTDEAEASITSYDKWVADTGIDDPATFLRTKKGYLPHIVEGATLFDQRGDKYVFKVNPTPKYRVIVLMDLPWLASDENGQHNANNKWAERINALAFSLGLHHDQSCKDTSRLFYLPRRPSLDRAFEFVHIKGDPCPLFTLPEAPAPTDEQIAAAPGLFSHAQRLRPRVVESGDKVFRDRDGNQINLTHWAAGYADRFEIVTALRQRRPGVFGNRKTGAKWHIECPFDDEHTAANDRTGTYITNASDCGANGLTMVTSGFYIGCSHNACAARDRLDFLQGMLAKGWLTVADLTSDAFLIPLPPQLSPEQTQRVIDNLKLKAAGESPVIDTENDPGNIPAELYANLPGIMGSIHRYLVATNVKPQPVLALGAAIAAMSAAIGRKVMVDGWETRPNIYIVGIALTGAGKDRQLSGVKDILRAAGLLDKLVGAEDISSDSGLVGEARLPGKESHVMLIDEVGKVLGAMGDKNAGPHAKGVATAMLKLYSASRTTFKSKSYVDRKQVFTIDQPSISMFGATTPESLFNALRTDDLQAGLMSRVLIFNAGRRFPRSRKPDRVAPPDDAVEWFRAWDAVPANPNPLAMVGGEPIADPRPIGLTDGAQRVISAFEAEIHVATIDAQASDTDAVYVRAVENAYKLALIRACSGVTEPEKALITEADMRWAVDLSRALTAHMADLVQHHVHDSDYQRAMAAIKMAIRKSGWRGLTWKELARKKCAQRPDAEKIVNALNTAGEVAQINVNEGVTSSTGKAIKSRMAWVYVGDQRDVDDEDNGENAHT